MTMLLKHFCCLSKLEGIIPALEPSHAISYAIELAKNMDRNENIVVTLSGRGDKDVDIVQRYLKMKENEKNKNSKSQRRETRSQLTPIKIGGS